MNKIVKNSALIIALVACGISEMLSARPVGGRGGGGARGAGFRGGGMRGGGARGAGMRGGRRAPRGAGMRRPARGQAYRRGHYGHHGRYWHHSYPYRYGRYPWGFYLLATAPLWWTTLDWGTYYADNPALQRQIADLQAQLNANIDEMRTKDQRLADLEAQRKEADDETIDALDNKIEKLKIALRKQARQTKQLEKQLKATAGLSDEDIAAKMPITEAGG